jgi:TonB family protein
LNTENIARLFVLAVISLTAAAQPPVYRPGSDVTAPFVVAKTPAPYSEEARLAKLEGSVLLSVVVGADGKPGDIQVARPLGLGLDENAIQSLRAWQFKPGIKNGMPVAVRVNEEVFFRPQRTLWDWHAVRAVFQPPAGAARPVLTKVKFPATVDVEENASVTMAFDVGADGAPANVRVLKSSDARWESELLAALREGWRFQPAMMDGKPVTSPTGFEFVRGSHSPIPAVPIPAPSTPPH